MQRSPDYWWEAKRNWSLFIIARNSEAVSYYFRSPGIATVLTEVPPP
jgi:hypothetical protein